jgi:ankyrin repeat protein
MLTRECFDRSLLHRASAYSRDKDIRRLIHLGASPKIRTSPLGWLPISCSVICGNQATFEALVDQFHPGELRTLFDSRGWTLLHLAAESGSSAIIMKLLKLGLDPSKISSAASEAMAKELQLLELTPGDIAEFHQNGEVYGWALNEFGYSTK